MNSQVRTMPTIAGHRPDVTGRGGEPPRRKWHIDDIQRMLAAGILAEDEHIELVGGELVEMAPKNRRHEVLRTELHAWLSRLCPAKLKIAAEAPLHLAGGDAPEPDIIVYPANLKAPDLAGGDVALVIECADMSLSRDLGRKAAMYAAAGVAECWVVNAQTYATTVHRDPDGPQYRSITELAASALLTPMRAPELAVRLDELDLD